MKKMTLPDLDQSVLAALEYFEKKKPQNLDLTKFQFPLAVGSGNAYNTALALFSNRPAIIANESNLKAISLGLENPIKKKVIDRALLISASGEKDSIWEAKLLKKMGLKTTLLTCNPDSSAGRLVDEVLLFDKLPEPYTYNTSTYLGILLGAGPEKAKNIKKSISSLKIPKNFSKYKAYSFILPDELENIGKMIEIKRDELFGAHLPIRAFSFGAARHAKFVNEWKDELVISFGKNRYFGSPENRLEIPWPKNGGPASMMALSYYLIGLIQKKKPPYFKNNIAAFCKNGPAAFGQKKNFDLIVS